MLMLTAMSLVSATAIAADIKGEFAAGFEFGGDDLLKVTYTSGVTSTIRAGDGFYLKGGVSTPISVVNNLELVGLIGLKYTSVVGTNGDALLYRFPLDVNVRYSMEQHRFSAGITEDLAIDYSGSGVLSGVGTTLNSNLGFSVQYEYIMQSGFGIGARYTSLSYDVPDFNDTVNASSFGLLVTASF